MIIDPRKENRGQPFGITSTKVPVVGVGGRDVHQTSVAKAGRLSHEQQLDFLQRYNNNPALLFQINEGRWEYYAEDRKKDPLAGEPFHRFVYGMTTWPDNRSWAIDLDKCLDGNGNAVEWFQDMLDASYGMRACFFLTVSGRGLRVFVPLEDGQKMPVYTSGEQNGIGFLSTPLKGFTVDFSNVWMGDPLHCAEKIEHTVGIEEFVAACEKRHGAPHGVKRVFTPKGDPGDDWEQLRDIVDVREVVGRIRNDDRFETWANWITIGSAIAHCTGGSEEGFELFDEWTATRESGKYRPEDTLRCWEDYCLAPGAAGFGTLCHYADGVTHEEVEKAQAQATGSRTALVVRVQTPNEARSRFVAHTPTNQVYDRYTRKLVTWEACQLSTTEVPMIWPATATTRATPVKAMNSARVFFLQHELLTKCDGTFWDPRLPEIIRDRRPTAHGLEARAGEVWFNSWEPFVVPMAANKNFLPWLEHLQWLYPIGWEDVLAAFAWMVQRPGVKVGWVPVLSGPQGIGKDALLRPLVRATRAADIGFAKLQDGFDGALLKRTTVVLQEVEVSKKIDARGIALILKPLAASPPNTLTLNPKMMGQVEVPNVVNVVATTNHPEHLAATRDDRRAVVPRCSVDRNDPLAVQEATRRAVALHVWLDAGGEAAVMEMLSLHKVADRLAFPVWAAGEMQALMEENISRVGAWIDENVLDNVTSVLMLRRAYDACNPGTVRPQEVTEELSKLGWRRLGERVRREGGRSMKHHVWGRGEESDGQLLARFSAGEVAVAGTGFGVVDDGATYE